ncbi:hypothetical protein ANOM_007368 [Aspergillus nomiae NRRL 13137]|uniref:Uncharacterized protein n=1 Tax=Aspergillus nomiae NRRL (strain ATCC 15546 / NRRL 13137 / CBS 260.88 / M93) TaxID=1509407 RepID=A0A0L1IWQ3_ASPN3|nr:uncharacterized protein ANOM_007368 [Aspergillus nomiae NRRL 13137]KNG83850.1 hypothetical protein ANOM_007368 [Aspergillus nomiae NRRL 13137]
MQLLTTLLISTFVISASAVAVDTPPPFIQQRPPTPPPNSVCHCQDPRGSNVNSKTEYCCMKYSAASATAKTGQAVCQHFKNKAAKNGFMECCQPSPGTLADIRFTNGKPALDDFAVCT